MQWDFTVLDKLSNPLRAMGASTKDLEKHLKSGEDALAKLERQLKLTEIAAEKDPLKKQISTMKLFKEDLLRAHEAQQKTSESGLTLSKVFGAQGFFALEMLSKVKAVAGEVLGLAGAFVKLVVAETEFKNQSIGTLEVMLGSKDAAGQQFDMLEKASRKTKYTTEEMMGSYRTLFAFTKKYGVENTQDVVAASADIASKMGKPGGDAFMQTIAEIATRGKVNLRSLNALGIQTGLSPEKILKGLGEPGDNIKTISQKVEAGTISREKIISTLLGAVKTEYDKGGALGSLAESSALKSVSTQVKNLKEDFSNLFEDQNMEPLLDGLMSMRHLLSEDSETGQKLRADLRRVFEDIGAVISWAADHADTFESIMSGTLSVVEAVADSIRLSYHGLAAIADFTKGDIKAAEEHAKAIDKIMEPKKAPAGTKVSNEQWERYMHPEQFEKKEEYKDKFKEGFVGPIPTEDEFVKGKRLGEAIQRGIQMGLDAPPGLKLPDVVEQGKQQYKAKSPAEVMVPIGRSLAQGVTKGAQNEQITLPTPDTMRGGGGGTASVGAPSISFNQTINFAGAATDPQTTRQIEEQTKQAAIRGFQLALSNLNMS
jgi:hypothetical protein